MSDWFKHPTLEPERPEAVLRWLYDGYGGYLSEDARERILSALKVLNAERCREQAAE